MPIIAQVLVERLDPGDEGSWMEGEELLDLHPDVWGVYPRIDIIHQNVLWQKDYSTVNYNHTKSVKEMIYTYGGGAKPWPQKGTGRARQGSRRAPQWVNGGKVPSPVDNSYWRVINIELSACRYTDPGARGLCTTCSPTTCGCTASPTPSASSLSRTTSTWCPTSSSPRPTQSSC